MSKTDKTKIIETNRTHEGDTGSTAVQVAVLTERIKYLTEHLKANHKDHSTRRGLLMLVGRRRRLLRYYQSTHSAEQYKELITALEIRK